MKSTLLVTLFAILASLSIQAQQRTISGSIIDKSNKEPLAYATVYIPNTLIGTVTNDNGYFELKVPKERDTIAFSYIGYNDKLIVISQTKSPMKIALDRRAVQLSEIIVRSLSPIEYLKKAIAAYPNTIDPNAFEARGFFFEKSSSANDNSDAYQLNEAVFKSYIPKFGDTSKVNQNQLVLFREKNEGEFRSMLLDNKKVKKRIAKDKRKNGEKSEVTDEEMEEEMDFDLDGLIGGGPEEVLADAQTILDLAFFDEENFRKVKYSFGENSFYKNRDLIVIDFVSKRKIDMGRYSGSVYLDYENLAIVAVNYKLSVKIPFWINAILKGFMGFGIDNVTQEVAIKNQVKDNYWYPKELIKDISVTLEQKSQPEVIRTKQLYSIDQIITNSAKPIDPAFIFKSELEYQEQVFKIEGLEWDQVNVVKSN